MGLLEVDDYRLDALHRVDVALAPGVAVAQLVLVAPGELLQRTLFGFLVNELLLLC